MDMTELLGLTDASRVAGATGQPASAGDDGSCLNDLLMLAAGARARLGELLLAAKRITKSELIAALAAQRSDGRKLGAILSEKCGLTASEREVVLEFQRRQAGESPTSGKLYLGNILVATGEITRLQLIHALKWQTDNGGRLGAALVACGYATESQVTRGVSLQRTIVAAVLSAAMALAAPAVCAADTSTAKLTVMARIATFFRMQIEHQAPALTVTARDVERGYVEAPAASNFSVVTNTQEGFIIEFRPRSDMFRSVVVTGLQSPVEIGAQGGAATNNTPHGRTTFHQLGYRFMLRPDLQPGDYAWPLELSVRSA